MIVLKTIGFLNKNCIETFTKIHLHPNSGNLKTPILSTVNDSSVFEIS